MSSKAETGLKATYLVRKAGRSTEFAVKEFVGQVRVTDKRVYLGASPGAHVFDRGTGLSLNATAVHTRPWTLLRVLDANGSAVVETEAQRRTMEKSASA